MPPSSRGCVVKICNAHVRKVHMIGVSCFGFSSRQHVHAIDEAFRAAGSFRGRDLFQGPLIAQPCTVNTPEMVHLVVDVEPNTGAGHVKTGFDSLLVRLTQPAMRNETRL